MKTNTVETKTPSAKQVMRRFLSVNSKYLHILILTIIFSLITSAMFGLMTICFRAAIDSFGKTDNVFTMQTLLLVLPLVVLIPSQYLQQYLGLKYGETCERNMRNKTFEIVSRIDMQVLDAQQTGDILSRINDDLGKINRSLQGYFSVFLPQEIIGIAALAVSLIINWQLTVFSVLIVPVIMLLQIVITSPLTRFVHRQQQAAGESLSIANNLMGGYEAAKAFNMGKMLQKRYDAAVDKTADIKIKANRATILLSPLSQVTFFLPLASICGFGVFLAGAGRITPGGIMAVLILSMLIRNPVTDLSNVLSSFSTAKGCASRVFELWDMLPESKGGKETRQKSGTIMFSDVIFSYPGKPPVLNGLSFEISKGERIALAGVSGSGKSTVIKLLMGLYRRSSGEINIFGNSIDDWATDALRKNISYVGQDSYLFPGTIGENIAMGAKNPTDMQIQEAADNALLSDIDVNRETGEGGLRLSGGQRQRVAIARAMLKDAPLLLLDEPTSALDTQSEALVSEALRRLMKGRTTIIIAHRLSALRNIDRILCMSNGRIAESGTHEELTAMKGVYYKLYKSQEGGK